jgi:hypothetical protein
MHEVTIDAISIIVERKITLFSSNYWPDIAKQVGQIFVCYAACSTSRCCVTVATDGMEESE